MENTQTGPPLSRPDTVIDDHVDDTVLQISGAGHWFLEGWIGEDSVEFVSLYKLYLFNEDSVEFLVDSGSSVTAMSESLFQTLVYAGAPVGALGCTSKTLRGANGTDIGVSDVLTVWCRLWDC